MITPSDGGPTRRRPIRQLRGSARRERGVTCGGPTAGRRAFRRAATAIPLLLLATASCATTPSPASTARAATASGAGSQAGDGPPARAGQPVVLVHGAWSGGWDWRPVDRMLTSRGYDVYRATLTGLGERAHLVGPGVDLTTHVLDVVNLILFEDLHDVVLVGHSYGGMVITGVADSVPDRLAAVVYVDAMLPRSGESVADMTGMSVDGDVVVPAWVDPADPYPRDVPHPAGTITQPLLLDGPPAAGVRAEYILTVEPGREPDAFQSAADRATAMGWPVHVLETGHHPQRTAREELVAVIDEIAGRGGR